MGYLGPIAYIGRVSYKVSKGTLENNDEKCFYSNKKDRD